MEFLRKEGEVVKLEFLNLILVPLSNTEEAMVVKILRVKFQ